MKRILVIRFSSMGDVLLTGPILRGALKANPQLQIDLLTKKGFEGYFSGIDRLNVISADTGNVNKGVFGIIKLGQEIIKTRRPDAVLDLHGVIRSLILRLIFTINGIKTYSIDKGRKEKRDYLKGRIKLKLKHTTERYFEVFEKAGVKVLTERFPFMISSNEIKKSKSDKIKIGLAPFARHEAKTWPLSYMVELMYLLAEKLKVSFHIYGGSNDEKKLSLIDFEDIDVSIHTGKLSPEEELKSISQLDIFVSMDSANMHLADLLGIPVISIWGGTHPDLGFSPLNQPDKNNIQTTVDLSCRPCSVYGNKRCTLVDTEYKCLMSISPYTVAEKILESLS